MYDTQGELQSIERTRKLVNALVWVIAGAAILFSLMTGSPLVAAHSYWGWTGWVLAGLVDVAFMLAISADAVLSKHGMNGGRWATAFRWVTGLSSLFLNIWSSIEKGDAVGVAIHSIAPVILILTGEVAPVYRRKFRDLELTLKEQVKEETVHSVLSSGSQKKGRGKQDTNGRTQETRKRTQDTTKRTHNEDTSNEDTRTQDTLDKEKDTAKKAQDTFRDTSLQDTSLTANQQAIKDGFLNGVKAADVARETGLSRSYVSKQYRVLKDETA